MEKKLLKAVVYASICEGKEMDSKVRIEQFCKENHMEILAYHVSKDIGGVVFRRSMRDLKVCLLNEAPQVLVVDSMKKVCTNSVEEKHLRDFANLLGIDVLDISQGGKLPAVVNEEERKIYEESRKEISRLIR